MHFVALATDYDNTLATDGRVVERTWSVLEKQRQSGRQLLLVSGRELAQDAKTVEREISLSPDESRGRIRAAVEKWYTQPANPSLPPLRAA